MAPGRDASPARRPREIGRLVVGALAEFGFKAYGAAAATSVALSDEETVSGKAADAVGAVRNLKDRYDSAEYVFQHRQEIETALVYVQQNAPRQAELQAALDESSETLNRISTTFDELGRAGEALGDVRPSPRRLINGVGEAFDHVKNAVEARPDPDSLRELGARAEQAGPLVAQTRVLAGPYYTDVLDVVDNFAGDEVVATLGVMAAALTVAFLLGRAVGFWARRGRPGLLARVLQGWGARLFRRWYVSHLTYAMSAPLHAAARERLQRDIVADPEAALDPDAYQELALWFANRSTSGP